MELITKIMDLLDPAKLVPQMDTFMGRLQTVAVLAALIGPLVMLGFGLWYLFRPIPEANHKLGFRTYFGMGSVQAWQFTQKLAGKCFSILGGAMTLLAALVCIIFAGKEPMQSVQAAAVCLIVEAVLAFLCWLGITVLVSLTFDKNGKRRN